MHRIALFRARSLVLCLVPLLLCSGTVRAEEPTEDLLAKARGDLTGLARVLNSATVPYSPEDGEDGRARFRRFVAGTQKALEAQPELVARIARPAKEWGSELRRLLVAGYLRRAYHQALPEALGRLVALPTPTPPGSDAPAREQWATFLGELRQLAKTWKLRHRPVARGRGLELWVPGRSRRRVVALAFGDTLPVASEDGWTRPPLSGAVAGRRVHGRGAVTKGGIAAALFALRALADSGLPVKALPTLIVLPGGERARTLGKALLSRKSLGSKAFVIDGRFPVGLGENGALGLEVRSLPGPGGQDTLEGRPGFKVLRLEVEATPDGGSVAAAVIDPRETPLRRATAIVRRGLSLWKQRGLGSEGRAREARGGGLRIELARPGGTTGEGPGPLAETVSFLADELGVFPDARGLLVRFLAAAVGLKGDGAGLLGLAATHELLAPTALQLAGWTELDDGGAAARIDISWPPGRSVDDIRRRVARAAQDFASAEGGRLEVSGEGVPPHLISARDPVASTLLAAYSATTGRPAEPYYERTPSAAKAAAPIPVFGPLAAEGRSRRGLVDESVGTEELVDAARCYTAAYLALARLELPKGKKARRRR